MSTETIRSVAGGPGTTVLRSSGAVMTANHHLAAAAGAEIIEHGGNAYDAAAAMSFALGVVEPAMSGLGGRSSVMVRSGSQTTAFSADPGAPLGVTETMFRVVNQNTTPLPGFGPQYEVEGDANATGPLAVVVPSGVRTVCDLQARYGRLPLSSILVPAVRLARDGFEVDATLAAAIQAGRQKLSNDAYLESIFVPDGICLGRGDRLVQSDLAATLEAIATGGPDEFYRGTIAQKIVGRVRALGGVLSLEDMSACSLKSGVRPVRSTFHGHELHHWPGAAGGVTLAQILSGFELLCPNSQEFGAEELEALLIALEVSFADRWKHLDDLTSEEELSRLISPDYVAGLLSGQSARNDSTKTPTGSRNPSGDETTHLCVIDEEGTTISLTQSLWQGFGSGVGIPGTGIVMNGAMHAFNPLPGQNGSIGPGRQGPHSGNPMIVLGPEGETRLALGGAGGTMIISGLAQVLIRHLAHGDPLHQAINAPRIHTEGNAGATWAAGWADVFTPRELTSIDPDAVHIDEDTFGETSFARINGISVMADERSSGFERLVDAGAASSHKGKDTSTDSV